MIFDCGQMKFFSLIIVIFASIESRRGNSHNETINGIHIQIFENIAEISRPISRADLPVTFSLEDWSNIRSDSIRLLGNCINVGAQTIFLNRSSLNGQKILIQRHLANDTYTNAIMIDETRFLVQDLIDNTFYTVTSDRIRYLTRPVPNQYEVNFMVEAFHGDQLFLRYLLDRVKWKVRYDLLLAENDTSSVLQAYADIANDGSAMLMISSAELIGGDVQLRSPLSNHNDAGGNLHAFESNRPSNQMADSSADKRPPSISAGEELAGVYVFTVNDTFVLNRRSHYILPMFRPTITIERYGTIEKYFSSMDNRGNAQRAYRLRVPETFLPKGHVFVRESDRLVGETTWSDLSANETNEFTLGEDPDLQYIEYVQLNSRREGPGTNGFRLILSTYTVSLQLINSKRRAMKVEYRLKFSSQANLTTTTTDDTDNHLLQMQGSTMIAIVELDADDAQQFTFSFET